MVMVRKARRIWSELREKSGGSCHGIDSESVIVKNVFLAFEMRL
jgi:hypothetical protein